MQLYSESDLKIGDIFINGEFICRYGGIVKGADGMPLIKDGFPVRTMYTLNEVYSPAELEEIIKSSDYYIEVI